MDEAQDARSVVDELAAAIETEFGVDGFDAHGLAATIYGIRTS